MEKLLLLSCCAPCSCGVIEKLARQGRAFTVLFYNPNIDTEAEYQKRLAENKRVCARFGVPFAELPYEPEVWRQAVQGLEAEPERAKRCSVCFRLRLERAARPQRSQEELALIDRAKALLMDRNGMTEEQAHRYLQKKSMDSGAKLIQTAQQVLDSAQLG